jgi:hypothetical protein
MVSNLGEIPNLLEDDDGNEDDRDDLPRPRGTRLRSSLMNSRFGPAEAMCASAAPILNPSALGEHL